MRSRRDCSSRHMRKLRCDPSWAGTQQPSRSGMRSLRFRPRCRSPTRYGTGAVINGAPSAQPAPRPRSFTSMPCALAHSRTAVGFSPLPDALRPFRAGRLPPPARRTAATQCACVSRSARHARRSCRSRTRCRPAPKRTVRSPLTAVKVINQQNVYLLSHTCLFSLTGLALAHRPSQFKPRRLQQHRKARQCKPALAVAY
jgi:hypothetical protein